MAVLFRSLAATLAVLLVLPTVFNSRLTAQEPAADTETGAEEAVEEEVDYYAVPEDADTEALLKFIVEVRKPATPPKSRAEMIDHFTKAAAAIDMATDEILAASPEKDQAVTAVKEKLQALEMLQQTGNAEAAGRMEAFIESSLNSDIPEIRDLVKQVKLQSQLRNWRNLPQDARDGVVNDLNEEFAAADLGSNQLRMLMMFADAADRAGDGETAIAVIEKALPRFAEASDPQVQSRLPSLEGLINRLKLPGSKMELAGTLVDGSELDWEAYRGKVVLVDYWATWCGPCRAEIPNVLKEYERYSDKGFTVLGISLDTKKESVEDYIAKENLPWDSLYSSDEENNGWGHPMAVKYGINAIPRAILVDKDGIVVHMNARGPALGKELEKLLGPADSATTDASDSEAAAKTARAE